MYINYSNFYRSFHFLEEKENQESEMGIIILNLLFLSDICWNEENS